MSVKELCFDWLKIFIDGCHWSKSENKSTLKHLKEEEALPPLRMRVASAPESCRGRPKELGCL